MFGGQLFSAAEGHGGKEQGAEQEVAQMKMLRFPLAATWMDGIKDGEHQRDVWS